MSHRKLNKRIIKTIKRAQSLRGALIVNDSTLAQSLGVTAQTIWNWRKAGVLTKYERQGERVTIYKMNDVLNDLEKYIK